MTVNIHEVYKTAYKSGYEKGYADGLTNARRKIKTHFAKIIAEGYALEPYYSILYYDPEKKEYLIGYGSINRWKVFHWLEENFEIVVPSFEPQKG